MRDNTAGAKTDIDGPKGAQIRTVDQIPFWGWVEILLKKHGIKST